MQLLYVSLLMVGFKVKVWVMYVMLLSKGIFRSQSRGRLDNSNEIVKKVCSRQLPAC